MATNILYLPPVVLAMEVANNEDWIDGLEYQTLDTPPQPIDCTGIAFEMDLRVQAADATVQLHASTDNGFIVVNSNSWQFRIPAPTMLLVPPASYVFDLLGSADGFTRRLAWGTVDVFQGVTRSVPYYGAPVTSLAKVRVVGVLEPIP